MSSQNNELLAAGSGMCPLGAWADLPTGWSGLIFDGRAYAVARLTSGWYVHHPLVDGERKPVCRVHRGEEFWAVPGMGSRDDALNVPDDIAETLRIVLQGGYDCDLESEGESTNCSGCHKTNGQVH